MPSDKIFGGVSAAAMYYGVSRNSIYRWLKDGRLERRFGVIYGPTHIEVHSNNNGGSALAQFATDHGITLASARHFRELGLIAHGGPPGYVATESFRGTVHYAMEWVRICPVGVEFELKFTLLGSDVGAVERGGAEAILEQLEAHKRLRLGVEMRRVYGGGHPCD